MRTLLNIIWLVLSGFWLFLGYALAALIMFALIVTIPWGIAAWRIRRVLRTSHAEAGVLPARACRALALPLVPAAGVLARNTRPARMRPLVPETTLAAISSDGAE